MLAEQRRRPSLRIGAETLVSPRLSSWRPATPPLTGRYMSSCTDYPPARLRPPTATTYARSYAKVGHGCKRLELSGSGSSGVKGNVRCFLKWRRVERSGDGAVCLSSWWQYAPWRWWSWWRLYDRDMLHEDGSLGAPEPVVTVAGCCWSLLRSGVW